MKPSTEKALDRLLRKMARPPREPRGRFSTAPLVLGLGLVLGYQLLVRLVPRVWATMLPGGLEQARFFRGWPGLVWMTAVECHANFGTCLVVLAVAVGAAFLACRVGRLFRMLVWLTTVGLILLNAGIVYVTLRTAYEATARASGIF